VKWLWDRRIPKGKVKILDGKAGLGKSTIFYDMAARITTGRPLPDGQPTEKGGAIIVSMEDGAADTIVPRFLAAGGDPKRARIIGSGEPFVIPDDMDKLERAIKQVEAALVVIDPVMSFLSDNINSNRDQDVRRALQPLVDIAERTGAAIVICRHLNKSTGGDVTYRGQGSVGFIGIVRSGLIVGEHPELDNVRVLAGMKNNLSVMSGSLAYRITGAKHDSEVAVVEYMGDSEITAQQMNATPEDEGERDRLAEAKEFLRDALRAGPLGSKQIQKEAGESSIAWRTVERAKSALKVQSVKDPDTGKWQWVLDDPAEMAGGQSAHSSADVGGLGGLQESESSPPKLAEMAGFDSTTTTTTKNEAYIREDRQDRQDRQQANGELRYDEDRQDRQGGERRPHSLSCECDDCEWGEV
jgi:hypothetical protein